MKELGELIFISAPFSSKDDAVKEIRYEKVIDYCNKMNNNGVICYSPVAAFYDMTKRHKVRDDWEFWEKHCIVMLSRCQKMHVLMLEGWDSSTGVAGEITKAQEFGIDIIYINI